MAPVLDDGPALSGYTDPVLGTHTYDFYRCQRCQRLVTQQEMAEGVTRTEGPLRICPCGALKYAPAQCTWRDYAHPQVIRYARTRFPDAALRADLWLESATDCGRLARCWAWLRLWIAQAQVPQ